MGLDTPLTWHPSRHDQCPEGLAATAVPGHLIVIGLHRPGFRQLTLYLLTTLIDRHTASAQELAQLYAQRWQIELCLRNQSPDGSRFLECHADMVRKEWLSGLIAYKYYSLGHGQHRRFGADSRAGFVVQPSPRTPAGLVPPRVGAPAQSSGFEVTAQSNRQSSPAQAAQAPPSPEPFEPSARISPNSMPPGKSPARDSPKPGNFPSGIGQETGPSPRDHARPGRPSVRPRAEHPPIFIPLPLLSRAVSDPRIRIVEQTSCLLLTGFQPGHLSRAICARRRYNRGRARRGVHRRALALKQPPPFASDSSPRESRNQ